MSRPKILIVGCGAVGLTQGYHLSFGADITFLVRSGRSPAFQPPKKLYDYKENALRTFDNYRVIESPSKVANDEFYCVFDTLDGHTARSEGGIATLKAVGDLIRDRPQTFVLYDAIGLDMDEHYARTMGISKDRLVLAASMLAHQPTKSITVPETADASLVAQADMLYSYTSDYRGLMVINTQPKITKAISAIYDQHANVRIKVLPGFIGSAGMLQITMLHLVTWSIVKYPAFPQFRSNKELWNLMLKAQNEILTLPRFGWTGWLLSCVLGSWTTAKIVSLPERDALPLSYHEFNAFHHGAKVIKQDVQVIKDLIAEGQKLGLKMEALRQVCDRAEEGLKKVV